MINAVNIPINAYLALPDCPSCNKGKLVTQVNSYAIHCTMCNYSAAQVQEATEPRMSFAERVWNTAPAIKPLSSPKPPEYITRQQAIDKWMGE